jgi:hypothetical protein
MFSSVKILSSKLRKALAQLPYLPRALKLFGQWRGRGPLHGSCC